jgi:uncharacterized protein
MDFFVYSRYVPGTPLRDDRELLEEHWSYMDAFAETMIARGPTLTPDYEEATGSLHVLGLPSVDAAREFVAREPNNRAGAYAEHFIRRFENRLGRTMWEFPRPADEPRFLVIVRSPAADPIPEERLPAELRERLILYGALRTLEDSGPAGVALAVQASGRGAVDALLEQSGVGRSGGVEVHHWEFGGRR